ncbi:hypothetical protein BDZ45DRAFT_26998 [Acephala macrosclerotiorum]|nr:hypothetical protein BDZ45DRAFT_26998 [Acephala macrosclerotiorum]
MLERYLDNLTSYAETVFDTLSDGVGEPSGSEKGSIKQQMGTILRDTRPIPQDDPGNVWRDFQNMTGNIMNPGSHPGQPGRSASSLSNGNENDMNVEPTGADSSYKETQDLPITDEFCRKSTPQVQLEANTELRMTIKPWQTIFGGFQLQQIAEHDRGYKEGHSLTISRGTGEQPRRQQARIKPNETYEENHIFGHLGFDQKKGEETHAQPNPLNPGSSYVPARQRHDANEQDIGHGGVHDESLYSEESTGRRGGEVDIIENDRAAHSILAEAPERPPDLLPHDHDDKSFTAEPHDKPYKSLRKKSDSDGHNGLNSNNKSQTSLLIEYFETGKDSRTKSQRRSGRVKVTPSWKSRRRLFNNHIRITERKGTRKPSYTKRIQLSSNKGNTSPAEYQRAMTAAVGKGSPTGLSREASEVLNRVIISNPEADTERERERMAKAVPLSPTTHSTAVRLATQERENQGPSRDPEKKRGFGFDFYKRRSDTLSAPSSEALALEGHGQKSDGNGGEISGEETIESLFPRIKARVAERQLTWSQAAAVPNPAHSEHADGAKVAGLEERIRVTNSNPSSMKTSRPTAEFLSVQPKPRDATMRDNSLGHARRESIQARRARREEAREANVSEEADVDTSNASEVSTLLLGTVEDTKPVSLKGLFSVSTTSTKPVQMIRADIIRVLRKLEVAFIDIRGGFTCRHVRKEFMDMQDYEEPALSLQSERAGRTTYDARNPHTRDMKFMILEFEIFIIKVPLLSLHGIQFKRLTGGTWRYKNMADQILRDLRIW